MSPSGTAAPRDPDVSQSALLGRVRHDLRTPVNAIIGYSEMLLEDAEDLAQEDLSSRLQEILASGRTLLSLVNAILDPEKIAAAEGHIVLGDLGESIRQELRAPLNRIFGHCEVLLGDESTTAEFVPDLQRIHSAGKRLLALLDELPSEAEAGPDPSASPSDPQAEPAPPEVASASLLIAEDSEIATLLARRLGGLGYRITSVENGRDALALLEHQDFDLVLLDVMMPEIDGIEVLTTIKADPRTRHVPVIMISTWDDVESIARCIELGAEDYLPKPFSPVLLEARVSACLEKKRLHDRERSLFQQLQENFARLRELEALRDRVTHSIVHDLRAPLDSLLARLRRLQGEASDPHLRVDLEEAVAAAEVLLDLTDDLVQTCWTSVRSGQRDPGD